MIRTAIIGLGAIGQRLIKGFNNHPEIEITAVCDRIEELAIKTARELENARAFSDYEKMLDEVAVDLVYVAVPPKYHFQAVTAVIEKGIHVLCEKPLANSLEEAESLYLHAREKGIIQAMNFPLNYESGCNTFASLIESGYIGKLRRVELRLRFPQWPRAWQQNEWVAGREQGGYVLEVGVHFIQQMQRIFGPINVLNHFLAYPDDPQACEVGVIAQLETEEGTPILMDGLSQITGKEEIAFTVYGTEGTLSLLNWSELEGGKIGEPIIALEKNDMLTGSLIDELVKAIKGKQANLIDFKAGYDAQIVLEKLREN